MIKNFLAETIEAINDAGKTVDEDVTIILADHGKSSLSWDKFAARANFDYDAGYGRLYIRPDLVVVFSDGSWLERKEYDGCESWRHVAPIENYSCREITYLKIED